MAFFCHNQQRYHVGINSSSSIPKYAKRGPSDRAVGGGGGGGGGGVAVWVSFCIVCTFTAKAAYAENDMVAPLITGEGKSSHLVLFFVKLEPLEPLEPLVPLVSLVMSSEKDVKLGT